MSRGLTAGAAGQIAAKRLAPVLFYEGEFSTGTLRLWSGIGPITWNGQTWTGAGKLLGLAPIQESSDVAAVGFAVTLTGEASDIISLNLSAARNGLPGRIWLGFLEPDYVDFDFTKATTTPQVGAGVATLSVTRAGATATRVNPQGLIETVPANTARLDYDPTTLQCNGLLVEEARTNLVENGDAESDLAGWGANSSANARSQAHVISGAWAVKNTSTNFSGSGPYFRKRDGSLILASPATTYAYSLWVYADASAIGKTYQQKIEWSDAGGASISTSVAPAVALVAGWQRLSFVATSPALTAKCTPVFYTTAPQGVFDIYVDAVQFEAGGGATSFIPTSTGSVTRNADAPILPPASWFNESAFTIAYEFRKDSLPVTGGTTAMIVARTNNARAGYIVSGGSQLSSFDGTNSISAAGSVPAGTVCRSAFALDSSGMKLCRDGTAVSSGAFDGTWDSGANFGLGCNNAGGGQLNGWLRRVIFIPRKLADADLQSLTAGPVDTLSIGATRIVADPFKAFEGRFDVPEILDAGDQATIQARYESRLIDLDRSRVRRYTSEDQRRDYPDDLGFDYVPSLQDAKLPWGMGIPGPAHGTFGLTPGQALGLGVFTGQFFPGFSLDKITGDLDFDLGF